MQAIPVRVGPRGRLVVPAPIRHELGLEEGSELVARIEGGGIVLEPRSAAVERLQALVRATVPGGVSLVDELIAGRRAEAERAPAGRRPIRQPRDRHSLAAGMASTCYCMRMLTRRLQVLLDERQYARLAAFAGERNLSVGAAVREAIDRVVPATSDERAGALKRVLAAPAMDVPAPGELRAELEALRGRRG